MRNKLFLTAAAAVLLTALLAFSASGAQILPVLQCPVSGETTETIVPLPGEETNRLFLPSFADPHALILSFSGDSASLQRGGKQSLEIRSGEPFDLTVLLPDGIPEDGTAVFFCQGKDRVSLTFHQSRSLRTLFLTSANPAQGREWVEESKSHKAKDGGMLLLGADGHVVYNGGLKDLKGRGNSTWSADKKPYQIKLKEKTDLLETGLPEEAETTWVLLANRFDATLIHNTLSLDLAEELGLPFTPHCQPVDLYYDGEYRGSYLLSEKTEIGTGRVAIYDLESAIEDANPGVEAFDRLDTVRGTVESGAAYQWVSGVVLPEPHDKGYLLELDLPARAVEERSWFQTDRGSYVVCKSPEYLSEEGVLSLRSLFQALEDAVYNGGIHPSTGQPYTDFIDLNSLATCYLLMELAEDEDAFRSSTYFYKPGKEDKLYSGPVWDFDLAYGSTEIPDNMLIAGHIPLVQKLLEIPSFRQAVQTVYRDRLAPLLSGIVLSPDGTAQTGRLRSLVSYRDELAASRQMDVILWNNGKGLAYDRQIDILRDHLAARHLWLYEEIMGWSEHPPHVVQDFLDVPADAWYRDAVTDTVGRGLFNGVTSFYFRPEAAITRGSLVSVLYRMHTPSEQTDDSLFPDVKPGKWYTDAINWAARAGIVEGDDQGLFHPDQPVSRQDFMLILARSTGIATAGGDLSAFIDADTVSPYARDSVAWGAEAGLLQGNDRGEIQPLSSTTRAQAAAVIQRFLARYEGMVSIPPETMKE